MTEAICGLAICGCVFFAIVAAAFYIGHAFDQRDIEALRKENAQLTRECEGLHRALRLTEERR